MQESQSNQESQKKSNDNQKPNQIIQSLTTLTFKTRFFELFIENKDLSKQGLYLLEFCQNAAGSTDLATDRCGHDGPSWTPSSYTCAISSVAHFINLDDKFDRQS